MSDTGNRQRKRLFILLLLIVLSVLCTLLTLFVLVPWITKSKENKDNEENAPPQVNTACSGTFKVKASSIVWAPYEFICAENSCSYTHTDPNHKSFPLVTVALKQGDLSIDAQSETYLLVFMNCTGSSLWIKVLDQNNVDGSPYVYEIATNDIAPELVSPDIARSYNILTTDPRVTTA